MIPSTTLEDKAILGVGIGAFVVQASPCPRLMEATPNAKTNTSEIVLFILSSFQKLLIFSRRTLCAHLGAQVYFKKHLLIERHFGLSPPKSLLNKHSDIIAVPYCFSREKRFLPERCPPLPAHSTPRRCSGLKAGLVEMTVVLSMAALEMTIRANTIKAGFLWARFSANWQPTEKGQRR
jgi:hypothetical protein